MFQIDIMSRTPVYEQIIEQTEKFVLMDIMKPGDKFPSVRALSTQLSVNPNTIQKSMAELDRLGITISVPGKGSFIAENAKETILNLKRKSFGELKALLTEMALAGIDKKEILQLVDEVYMMGGSENA